MGNNVESSLPVYLRPFLKTKLSTKDQHFILGKPFAFNVNTVSDSTKAYAFIYNYNFAIGSTWALLSGMASGSFLQPDTLSSRISAVAEHTWRKQKIISFGTSYFVSRASVFFWRVGTRTSLCVLFFEFVERNVREQWDKWRKSIYATNNHLKIDNGYLLSIPISTMATSMLFPVDTKSLAVSAMFGVCMVGGLTLALLYYRSNLMKCKLFVKQDRLKDSDQNHTNGKK